MKKADSRGGRLQRVDKVVVGAGQRARPRILLSKILRRKAKMWLFFFGKSEKHCFSAGGSLPRPYWNFAKGLQTVKKGRRRGDPWSPAYFAEQNMSPQGEKKVISLREIRKTLFFGGRPRVAPTVFTKKQVFRQTEADSRGSRLMVMRRVRCRNGRCNSRMPWKARN